jgi:hypothetical protein
MTSLWLALTTVQTDVSVVANVSWRTAFSLPTKNARTVAVYLLRLNQAQLREVTDEGFTVPKNVLQKARVLLKKNHVLSAEHCFTHQAFTKTRYKKRVLGNVKQSFFPVLTHTAFEAGNT